MKNNEYWTDQNYAELLQQVEVEDASLNRRGRKIAKITGRDAAAFAAGFGIAVVAMAVAVLALAL